MTTRADTDSTNSLPTKAVRLEVCVDRLGDALSAVEAGADRLEVCSALELGGLTPSIGLLKQILADTDAEVVAMVRPRAGGLCYDRHDFNTCVHDAQEALAAGAHGVVFGFLLPEGTVDSESTGKMVEVVGRSQSVYHRAFDFTADQTAALIQLIELGVARVLTSGGEPTALAGVERLSKLTRLAAGRIEVMPGGGIRPNNVVEIVQSVGCRQVHVGAAIYGCDNSLDQRSTIQLSNSSAYPRGAYRSLDAQSVRQIADLLHELLRRSAATESQTSGGE